MELKSKILFFRINFTVLILFKYQQRGFDNIYIGWAQKYSLSSFNPYIQPTLQQEYSEEYGDLVEQIENELPRIASQVKLRNKSEYEVDYSQNDNSEEDDDKQ
jgi:hypothetical protein